MNVHERAKILIVDDEPSKLLSLQVVLEELGEELVTATSGREALRRLLNEDFAVILLDVNMPDIGGFETAALIRQRSRSEHIPIIFVTSYYDDARALQSYSLGAVDYIMTPIVPEILRAKVRVFVDMFRMQQQIRLRADEQVALAQEQVARQAAEKANRTKSEFLANISHELRTPMNAIIGMTELAIDEEISAAAREYLSTVRTSAYVLLSLLNEILDLSRLESGKFVLESIPFDLHKIAEDTLKILSVRAYERGIECACTIHPSVPRQAIGDPMRLRQIFMNLLGNAIKFTHQGEVVLRLDTASSTSTEVELLCSVTDTGIGISETDQQRIFAPFTQADSSMTRSYGGVGLGLAIVSDLVQMMGGRVWVQSDLGRGSKFSFTARLGLPSEEIQEAEAPVSPFVADGIEIPLIDRHPQQGAIIADMLRRWHLSPLLYVNETSFLEALRTQLSRGPFPLAVISWPNGDRSYREIVETILEEGLAEKILILIAASDRQVLSSWLNSIGQATCVEKPVVFSELLSGLEHLGGGTKKTVSQAAAPKMPDSSHCAQMLRILVAEDTPANQKLLTAVLSKRGHTVQVARDGREAADIAAASEFDVILMDVQMPVLDGLQATAIIRGLSDPDRRDVPIIAMTAHAMEGDRERFLAAGMDGYFAKPIHVPRLVEYLESHYNRRSTANLVSGSGTASDRDFLSM